MSATVGAALAQAVKRGPPHAAGSELAQAASGLARLDAQLLLGHVLQRPRAWLLAHEDAALSPAQRSAFAAACRRRAAGEPLAYVLGEREFHGLMLRVTPDVLVPRPDTETLVDWALELLADDFADERPSRVADLGTGSGAVALALRLRHAHASVRAVDISAAAVEVARANALRHALPIEFHVGDWWQPLRGQQFHLVVSNPPYVADGDPHLAALRFEPALALNAGPDGLRAIERIVREAPAHLLSGGWLLLEHGFEQSHDVRRLLRDAGFEALHTRADLVGRPRCTGGRIRA